MENSSNTTANEHDLSNSTTPEEVHHETSNSTTSSEDKKNESPPEAEIKMPTQGNSTSSATESEKGSGEETGKTARRRLLEDKDTKGDEDVHAATVENDGGLEAEADSSFELFRENDELGDEYNYDYDDYVDENLWGEEEWTEAQHEKLEDYVHIDAHVLCTPVSIVVLVTFTCLLRC